MFTWRPRHSKSHVHALHYRHIIVPALVLLWPVLNFPAGHDSNALHRVSHVPDVSLYKPSAQSVHTPGFVELIDVSSFPAAHGTNGLHLSATPVVPKPTPVLKVPLGHGAHVVAQSLDVFLKVPAAQFSHVPFDLAAQPVRVLPRGHGVQHTEGTNWQKLPTSCWHCSEHPSPFTKFESSQFSAL